MRLPGFSRIVFAFFFLAFASFTAVVAGDFRITSPDFAEGASIPSRFTCQGEDVAPTLRISGVPAGTQSLVLIVDDPDAPSGTFTHWLLWNIPPNTKMLSSGGLPAATVQGTNDFGKLGYSGPCPPSGSHRYIFQLSALNSSLAVPGGIARKALEAALRGHILATVTLVGRYAKAPQ